MLLCYAISMKQIFDKDSYAWYFVVGVVIATCDSAACWKQTRKNVNFDTGLQEAGEHVWAMIMIIRRNAFGCKFVFNYIIYWFNITCIELHID